MHIQEMYYLNQTLKSEKLTSLVSDICEKIYKNTPIINNEMMNKNEISAQMRKSREIVIDSVLNENKEMIKSNTSAEATIYKAIVDKKENQDIRNALNIIKEFIQQAENEEKVNFEELCKIIQEEPYGIRKGILPILIAISIEEYGENIVLYYQNKEIEMNRRKYF